jgi:hypothetical protein
MSYLKISSVSRTTITDLFTLGVSTSRGDATKIGQFGSGTLMGVLAWMRSFGDSPVFMVNGQKVTFTTDAVQKSDGATFGQVSMKIGRKSTPLSVALEYGELDWRNPELGLREWICNAIDKDSMNCLSVVSRIEASDDEVAVFVPYTGIAKAYHSQIDKYFLHFRGLAEQEVIEKAALSPCKIYRKGVFVCEVQELSLCDYNLNFDINECRTGSSDSLMDTIKQHNNYYSSNEHGIRIRDAVMKGLDCIEAKIRQLHGGVRTAFRALEGSVKFCSPNFLVAGCTPIPGNVYSLIRDEMPELDGLKHQSQAALEGFELITPRPETQKNFDNVCGLIEMLNLSNGKARPSLTCFKTKNGVKPGVLGFYQPAAQMVSIWDEQGSSIRTMVHELCHHYSGALDWQSEFADYAHRVIGEVVEQLL